MTYIEVCFNINVIGSAEINSLMVREILVAELGLLNFESFVNNDDSLHAYIQEDAFDEKAVKDLYIFHNPNFEINIEVNCIEQQNWNAEWEKSFEPIEVGSKCFIRAPFHDKNEVEFDIVITPKMSFGTGHHATTQLILEHLLELDFPYKSVLDIGTGTGVLAIAAKMQGAEKVAGIDIESWCVDNAMENAAKNDIYDIAFSTKTLDDFTDFKPDLILANINRNVLLSHLPSYAQMLSPGCGLILSGFHYEDVAAIQNLAQENGLKPLRITEKEGWICLKFII